MTINRHPDDATLMSFAAGTLASSLSAVVAAHTEWCLACRRTIAQMAMLGGILLEQGEPAPVRAGGAIRPVTLNVRELPVRGRGSRLGKAATAYANIPLPRAIEHLTGTDASCLRWRMMVPGVKHVPLELTGARAGDLRLLRIEPGRRLPDHGHRGSELTLVLQGSYTDTTGHYAAGDVADLDAETEHQPIVNSDEPCICLIASEQRARFKGFIGQILQPLIGM